MKKMTGMKRQSGFSLMEILVTMVIILIGLLGIVALQGKAQIAELEAYQRAQALIMMSDIVDRLNANRATASCFQYTTNTGNGTPFLGATGAGHLNTWSCAASTTAYNTQADTAMSAINDMLQGTAEQLNGNYVGGMLGARACVSYDSSTEISGTTDTGLYTIIVTWQGMGDLVNPTGLPCAVGLYGGETKRRAVSTTMRLADLY